MDGYHVAEVTPPSPPLTFHVVPRTPPPFAPFALGIPPGSQLTTLLAPEVAETWSRAGMISGPRGHEVLVAPPLAPFFATDIADRSKKMETTKDGGQVEETKG